MDYIQNLGCFFDRRWQLKIAIQYLSSVRTFGLYSSVLLLLLISRGLRLEYPLQHSGSGWTGPAVSNVCSFWLTAGRLVGWLLGLAWFDWLADQADEM